VILAALSDMLLMQQLITVMNVCLLVKHAQIIKTSVQNVYPTTLYNTEIQFVY